MTIARITTSIQLLAFLWKLLLPYLHLCVWIRMLYPTTMRNTELQFIWSFERDQALLLVWPRISWPSHRLRNTRWQISRKVADLVRLWLLKCCELNLLGHRIPNECKHYTCTIHQWWLYQMWACCVARKHSRFLQYPWVPMHRSEMGWHRRMIWFHH